MRRTPMTLKKKFWFGVSFLIFFLVVPSQAKEPVKVGFVGGLTGKISDLGTSGRNGVILAVEEKNAQGGLLGRPVELLIRDDKQDPKEALRMDEELIGQGVIAIIGHMTSAMSMAAKPLIDSKKVLMISPTTSSTVLSQQKDFFFRVYETIEGATKTLPEFVFRKRGVRTLGAVYDLSNRSYTEDVYTQFRSHYESLGGKILLSETFISGKDKLFSPLVQRIRDTRPQGLFILSSASDTAMICQQVYKLNLKAQLILSGWSLTEEFPALGGRSVEGAFGITAFDPGNQTPKYLEFEKRFRNRFGQGHGFPGLCGYEAAQVLFKAYEEAKGEVSKLPETILRIKTFQGLQGEIQIDEYGDAHRRKFITAIEGGKFKVIE